MKNYYQDKAFGMIFGDTDFNTPVGRLFWMALVTPKAYRGSLPPGAPTPAPKYEATIAFPKDDPKTAIVKAELEAEAAAMIEQYNLDIDKKINIGKCEVFQDGDAMDTDQYPFIAGCYVLTARNKNAVCAVNKDGDDYPLKDLLGGVQGRLAVTARLSSKGLSYQLKGVQFIADDGKRFGGGAKSTAALFGACETHSSACATEKTAGVAPAPAAQESLPNTSSAAATEQPAPIPSASTGGVKAQKGKNAIVNML